MTPRNDQSPGGHARRVVGAAVVEAERVLGDRTRFVLDDDDWARFSDALDREPRDVPGLARLFASRSVFE